MSIKCKLGFHSWDGCECTECAKIRDELHDWSNDCEKCSKCGKVKENQHDYSKDCEKCSKCGKTIEIQHDWTKDCVKCSKCEKKRDGQHIWEGCKCSICSIIRDELHNWTKNCEKCFKCGKTRNKQHVLVCNICKICGQEIFTDIRDGNSYTVVKIGDQLLMAENLAYKPSIGNYWAYGNIQSNIAKYGYLYDWETAKQVAPKGWHLPSFEEWETLHKFLADDNKKVFAVVIEDGSSGFNALLGGYRDNNGSFVHSGTSTHFWSSTECAGFFTWAFRCGGGADPKSAGLGTDISSFGNSIRLFRDHLNEEKKSISEKEIKEFKNLKESDISNNESALSPDITVVSKLKQVQGILIITQWQLSNSQTLIQQIVDQQRSNSFAIASNFIAKVGVSQDLNDKAYVYAKIRTEFSNFGGKDLLERTRVFPFQASDGNSGNYYIIFDRP